MTELSEMTEEEYETHMKKRLEVADGMLEIEANAPTGIKDYMDMRREWLTVLSELWTAYGKAIEKDRLAIYARDLDYVPFDLLKKAVKLAIRNQTYHTPPTFRAVEDALCEHLLVDDFRLLPSAVAAWVDDSFNRCIYIPDEETTREKITCSCGSDLGCDCGKPPKKVTA